MFSAKLFLGLELTADIERCLAEADPEFLKAFISPSDDAYLQLLQKDGSCFLGKYADAQNDVVSLEQLEVNIQSLLVKIIPPEKVPNYPLLLIPIVEAENDDRKPVE